MCAFSSFFSRFWKQIFFTFLIVVYVAISIFSPLGRYLNNFIVPLLALGSTLVAFSLTHRVGGGKNLLLRKNGLNNPCCPLAALNNRFFNTVDSHDETPSPWLHGDGVSMYIPNIFLRKFSCLASLQRNRRVLIVFQVQGECLEIRRIPIGGVPNVQPGKIAFRKLDAFVHVG
jgi:hypothetical protein